VVGQTLACLLHPAAPTQLPFNLRQEALQLLSSRAKSMASPAAALAALGASKGVNGVSARSESEAWKQRARAVPALAKLLELTGMQSVKEELFKLADQV